MKIFLIVGGILGTVLLLCCVASVGFWLLSTSVLATAVKAQFNDHPIVQRELGAIDNITLKFWESVEEQSRSDKQYFVFDVSGPNGSGKIIVAEQAGDQFKLAILKVGLDTFDLME